MFASYPCTAAPPPWPVVILDGTDMEPPSAKFVTQPPTAHEFAEELVTEVVVNTFKFDPMFCTPVIS